MRGIRRSAVLALLFACACTPKSGSTNTDTIKATSVALSVANEALRAWDVEHMKAIADQVKAEGKPLAEYEIRVAAYRKARDGVVPAMRAAYDAVKVAAERPSAETVSTMLAKLQTFYDAVKALSSELKIPAIPRPMPSSTRERGDHELLVMIQLDTQAWPMRRARDALRVQGGGGRAS